MFKASATSAMGNFFGFSFQSTSIFPSATVSVGLNSAPSVWDLGDFGNGYFWIPVLGDRCYRFGFPAISHVFIFDFEVLNVPPSNVHSPPVQYQNSTAHYSVSRSIAHNQREDMFMKKFSVMHVKVVASLNSLILNTFLPRDFIFQS